MQDCWWDVRPAIPSVLSWGSLLYHLPWPLEQLKSSTRRQTDALWPPQRGWQIGGCWRGHWCQYCPLLCPHFGLGDWLVESGSPFAGKVWNYNVMTSPPPSSNISKTFYNDLEGVCVGGGGNQDIVCWSLGLGFYYLSRARAAEICSNTFPL